MACWPGSPILCGAGGGGCTNGTRTSGGRCRRSTVRIFDKVVALIFTRRNDVIRFIPARRARKD